ncbi:MAG: T9SS type A sorting domain-containing protein [Bacteroidetes bacterium]|nr:T9SS type A sorting domain-containing protein [Bacteroidota bacterium]
MKRLLFYGAFSFLFLQFPLLSQAQIGPVGRSATFDVATWNIEWFGAANSGPSNDALQVQNVKNIIVSSEIELWAVQEISHVGRFSELLTLLGPDWSGELATNTGSQRIGFVWDKRVVTKRSSTHILETFSDDFAGRPPLKAEFTISLPDTTMIVTLINVHMKAFGDAESYQRRVNASGRVKNHIDFSSLASASVVFLGDFNDELLSSTFANQVSPYQNFMLDPAGYSVLSLKLEQADRPSWVGSISGSNLDHIFVSNELAASYIPNSINTMDALKSVFGYTAQTSDHLPVYASFGSSIVLDVDDHTIPSAFAVRDLYPNPAQTDASLTIDVPNHGTIAVQLFDALGRMISSSEHNVTAGRHTLPLNLEDVPRGAYFVRMTDGRSSSTKPLVVVK